MASGVTRISDVIVPEIFSQYIQNYTEEKSRLIRSGAVAVDAQLSGLLNGGGITFHSPSWNDLDNDEENVSSDDPTADSTPNKISSSQEIQVRLNRNNSWSSMDLAAALAGSDPVSAIGSRVGDYWLRREQVAFVATMLGLFANNDATENDMTNNVSGSSFQDGVTNFSTAAFIDAITTIGDSMDDLGMLMVHSVVYNRMLKNNLIDFIPDSINTNASPYAMPNRSQGIPRFLGREVIVDDGIPATAGVFQTWIFGAGSVRRGSNPPATPTEVERKPSSGNGGGQDILYNRVQWIIHPVGYAYAGTPPNGGPSNANTANNLANANSWKRAWPERKQIKIARLVTREYA